MKGFTDFVTLLPTSRCLKPLLANTLITRGGAYSGLVGIFYLKEYRIKKIECKILAVAILTTSKVKSFFGKLAFFLSLMTLGGGICMG